MALTGETCYYHEIETADGDVREVCYEHVDGDQYFTVTAAERWSITMVKRLKETHSDDVQIVAENADGSLVAHMPLRWMKIKPTKRYSEETKQKLLNNLRKD